METVLNAYPKSDPPPQPGDDPHGTEALAEGKVDSVIPTFVYLRRLFEFFAT
jgi:hypothetical protein